MMFTQLSKPNFDVDGDVVMAEPEEEVKQPVVQAQATAGPSMSKIFTPKPFTNHAASQLATITKFVEVTIYELYLKIKQEEKDSHRKVGDEETCPICKCELYDDVEKTPEPKLIEMHKQQMAQIVPIDVVIMSKCTDHCFHKECLEQ